MITDINFKNVQKALNKKTLADYWNYYFAYQNKGGTLHSITENELKKQIKLAKQNGSLFIDSQIVISKILTELGQKHNFHRQFNEIFPGISKEQVLGMQLYTLMLTDDKIWIYYEIQHLEHKFLHATYHIPKTQTAEYINLCNQAKEDVNKKQETI
jgi:hypothetical protein